MIYNIRIVISIVSGFDERDEEFEWQLLIKSFSMTMGSRRLILRSPTMNTWSNCEIDDKILFCFIVNSGILDFSGGLLTQIMIKVQLFESETFTTLIS